MSIFTFFYVVGLVITAIGVFHEENKDVSVFKKIAITIGWPVFLFAAIIYLFKEAIEKSLNDNSK
ncbi:hypothetical protein [Chitinophaga ginsengisegetis]|uniref:hypothetical protein n=1 Tax=Chitinophaga ginsengisegetis TaxID=393003 RepID=UPI00105829D9|nr:hypothetical protein [Chitinophaga ginsengisegetis]MDR6565490.1 hypothetical protein [Chitinophaga ginsengisegetis]MDR6645218.1 hypothetical protein [Chitinophaga ginsengisegetis]MDR6652190.1 hypothetical protein [Chitinophaga ginsengisegetis]